MNIRSRYLPLSLVIALFMIFCFHLDAGAQQAELGWNADTGTVAGYKVYYGQSTGNYTSTVDAGANTTYTLTNLSAQAYFIAVAAYDSNNNVSAYSPELVIYSMAASAGTGGSITPSGSFFQSQGESQTFTIAPTTGYSISDVQVDGKSVGAVPSYTFSSIAANHTISATFTTSSSNGFTITPSAGANGTISPSSAVTVSSGASQTFTITPATGYSISNVLVDGNSAGTVPSYTFSSIAANHTISATFAQNTYTITPTAGTNGTISPSAVVTVNSGASQTFTVTPTTGCSISNVLVDGNSVGAAPSYTFSNVTANHTISATFAQNTYTITSTAGANGTISPSGSVSVSSGAGKTFTITPAANCRISNVSVDGISKGAASSYTFTKVTANHTITANFAFTGHVWIRAAAQGGGSISPAGTVSVAAGTSRSFTIKPAAGHKLTSVLVDGTPTSAVSAGKSTAAGGLVGAVATYTFADLENDHSIEAVFSPIPPPVTDPGPDQIVKAGSTVTLDGSNSTDAVVGIASYRWTQVSGPRVALSNVSGPICTFTAPNVTGGKLLGFRLTVTNYGGVTKSETCFVNVSASDLPPMADAGAGQTVSPYTVVTLNGSGSSDPDGNIASYQWVQISGPKVEISNAKTSNASFAAPNPGSLGASLVFQLQVTDRLGLATRDQCTVNVVSSDPPPVADAGSSQTVQEGSAVALDGSDSLDPAGSAVTYRWKQIRGVPVTLSDPSVANPVFTAPFDTGADSPDLLFMLTVTDTTSQLSATAECDITIASQ